MQRLCDVCHGVYSNNSSFSAHQRKTGHKQIASVDGQQAKIVESSNDPGQLKDSLKGKDASIIQLEEKTKLHGGNKFCQLSQRFINFLTIFSHKRYTKSTLDGSVQYAELGLLNWLSVYSSNLPQNGVRRGSHAIRCLLCFS